MGRQKRCQLDGLASPSGHGTKPKLANEPGYRSRDLCCDESRTRVALTLSWHQGGMELSPGDKARNEIFNVSNGDVYRWRQVWNELAAFYDLPIAEPLAMSTVSEMSEKAP